MSKLEWDKRTAQDKASHLRELSMPNPPQPERMRLVLQIKTLLSRIEREEWIKIKSISKQQKKQLSLYRQLKREYEKYVSNHPSVKSTYFAQQVQRVLSSCTHLNLD
jgi:hypothetical protein